MVSRREILSTIVLGGVTAGAGCADGSASDGTEPGTSPRTPTATATDTAHSDDDGFVSPTGSPDGTPTHSCGDDSFERLQSWVGDGVVWGTMADDGPVFTLRVSDRSVALGETITITFRNVSDAVRTTGNLHGSNLSIRTEQGWTEVRGWADGQPRPITDDLWEFDPGETHVWELPLTAEGVIEASYPNHRDVLAVCPSLQSGRYRFATGAVGESGEGLAVSFDVTDSG